MDRRLVSALAFAAVLTTTLAASAQSISSFIGTSTTNYMLDGHPTPSRAYSLHRLLTSYSTNKLINIVRASDSTTTDIGFISTGALDIATAVTFCNATTCKIVTWYDQSGAGLNLTQGTDGNRPALTFNCLSTQPCIRISNSTTITLAGSNITPATGVVSISAVGNRSSGTGVCTFLRENGNNNRLSSINATASWAVAATGNVAKAAADVTWHAAIGIINTTNSILNIDGVETTGSITGSITTGAPAILGTTTTTCDYLDAIFWDNTALDTVARTMITTNQRSWWGF